MTAPPTPARAAPAKRRWPHVASGSGLILLVWVAVVVAFALTTPGFVSLGTAQGLLLAALPVLLLAAGQTLVLITGGIDLSATAVVGLASVGGALVMREPDGPFAGWAIAPLAGAGAMVAIGAACGAVNGGAVARLRLPPFMVTLATFTFAGGLAVWAAQRAAGADVIGGLPIAFVSPGGSVATLAGGTTVVLVAADVLLARSLGGRWLRAVGQNARAARVSGVPVPAVTAAAYVLSGIFAALAALLLTARLEAASPLHGRPWLLDVIGAAVLGGTSLSGGRGTIRATACGVLLLATLGTGLTLLNLSDVVITIVKGGLLIAAAALDVWRTRWGARTA